MIDQMLVYWADRKLRDENEGLRLSAKRNAEAYESLRQEFEELREATIRRCDRLATAFNEGRRNFGQDWLNTDEASRLIDRIVAKAVV